MRVSFLRGMGVSMLGLLAAGCQTYMPVPMSAVVPGNDVRITMTDPESRAVATAIGPKVTGLDGTVVSRDATAVRIAVHQLRHETGTSELYHDEVVTLPVDVVASAEVKRLSKVRSLLLAGAIAIGGAIIVQTSENNDRGFRGGPPTGSQ